MASMTENGEINDSGTDNKEVEENIVLPASKRSKEVVKDPNFAVVCSFIKIFGPLLRFQELSIETIEHFFDTPTKGNQDDVEALFIKLLRKVGRNVVPDKWERSLLKLAKEFDISLAWDLEQFGFEKLTSEAKLTLLKYLLESQFDKNDKFKSAVNCELRPDDLRPEPIGSDIDGLIYWFQEDELLQVRLYSTEEDELDCEAWKVLACDVEEIMDVISYLEKKSESNPKEKAKAKKEEKRKQYALKQQMNKKLKKKNVKGKKSKKKLESNRENECNDELPSDESDLEDENPCARCYSGVHPEWILLCDKCDAAYHTACLRPPLMQIPEGDWFCPYCNTLSLIGTLKEIHSRISTRLKVRSRAANRQNANGINVSNIRQSGRVRKTIDYTFADFDQEIFDAVDLGEVKCKRRSYGISEISSENVGQFNSFASGTRHSKRRRCFEENDSDLKDCNYELPDLKKDPDLPKHPERHVYLRRHENGQKENADSSSIEGDQREQQHESDEGKDDSIQNRDGPQSPNSETNHLCVINNSEGVRENILNGSDAENEESKLDYSTGDFLNHRSIVEPIHERQLKPEVNEENATQNKEIKTDKRELRKEELMSNICEIENVADIITTGDHTYSINL